MKPLRTRPLLRLTPLTLLLLLPVCDRSGTEEPPPDSGPGICAELPAPPSGQRCTTTPSPSGSKSILLKGTLLLPDSALQDGQVLIDDRQDCLRLLRLLFTPDQAAAVAARWSRCPRRRRSRRASSTPTTTSPTPRPSRAPTPPTATTTVTSGA
jgi:hypothetical protein